MSFLGQNLMILYEFHLYTCGISIALAIHSLDRRWGFGVWVSSRFYKPVAALGLWSVGVFTFLQTCRPSGALECGVYAYLQTCRPAGAKMRRISRFY